MGTPLKSLLSPKVLSPIVYLSPNSLKTPRHLAVSNNATRNFDIRLDHVSRRLDFLKLSPNSKFLREPIKIHVTEHLDSEIAQTGRDIVINTPNKNNITQNGLVGCKFLNILGTGRFGKVIRGIHKGEVVAVKVVKNTANLKEKNALFLDHRNIVKTIDIIENSKEKFSLIIMEYLLDSQQLQSVLENPDVPLDGEIIIFSTQISEGLKFCHECGVLHLDIKPQNILLCDGVCKLCDFGNSLKITDLEDFKHQGTIAYTAPELLQGRYPTEKCDVYSLGILFWQLRNRSVPYFDIDNFETVIYKVVKCNLRPESEIPSDGYSKLYQKCWCKDPECRPSISEILDELPRIF